MSLTITGDTTGNLIEMVAELQRKADAFDRLLAEVESLRRIVAERATSYYNQAKGYDANLSARNAALQEFAYGRGGAYNVTADQLAQIIAEASA